MLCLFNAVFVLYTHIHVAMGMYIHIIIHVAVGLLMRVSAMSNCRRGCVQYQGCRPIKAIANCMFMSTNIKVGV